MATKRNFAMQNQTINFPERPKVFLRLPSVLQRYPVSKSHWWEGVRTGKYPAGYKLSQGITVWLERDIDQLIAQAIDPSQAA